MKEVVLDTETTGLSTAQKHRIVEVGCVELNNQIATHEDALGGAESEKLTALRDKLKELLEEKTKIFRTGTQGFFTLFFDRLRERVDLIVDKDGELDELENQRIKGPGMSTYFRR